MTALVDFESSKNSDSVGYRSGTPSLETIEVRVELKRQRNSDSIGYKYCRSCWRKDLHQSIWQLPKWARRILNFATLGLIRKIEPSRCVCCGTVRVF